MILETAGALDMILEVTHVFSRFVISTCNNEYANQSWTCTCQRARRMPIRQFEVIVLLKPSAAS